MGKAGRFACIFVPMALTIASLICLLLVFMGNLNKNNSSLSSLYFFKADTSNFTANPKFDIVSGSNIDEKLLAALQTSASSQNLKDFYTVGLWNYCSGDKDEKTGAETITYCSPRKASFWFNPVEVWGLNGTTAEQLFPEKLDQGLQAYQKVVKWMFASYTIAFWVTVAEIVVGIFAIFSRWGSCVTTLVSSASTLFTLSAAITSTALYAALAGTFNTVLEPYHIHGSLNTRMLSVVWLAVAFSLGAGLFWLISTCCCSGKSKNKKVVVEKTPYTYERVASPYLGARDSTHEHGGEVPLKNMGHEAQGQHHGAAYEPFRHDSRV